MRMKKNEKIEKIKKKPVEEKKKPSSFSIHTLIPKRTTKISKVVPPDISKKKN